ncbi:hypothetical protein Tco_1300717 [Tanacetum coccineum]
MMARGGGTVIVSEGGGRGVGDDGGGGGRKHHRVAGEGGGVVEVVVAWRVVAVGGGVVVVARGVAVGWWRVGGGVGVAWVAAWGVAVGCGGGGSLLHDKRKVQTLQTETKSLSAQLTLLQRDVHGLTAENNELKLRLQTMEQQGYMQHSLNEALRKEMQHLKVVTDQNLTNGVPMVEFRSSFGPHQYSSFLTTKPVANNSERTVTDSATPV